MNLEKAKGSVDALDAEKEIELLASFMTKLKATYGDKSVDSVPDNGDNSPRSLSQPARQQSNLNPAISAPITAPDINTSANVDEEGFSIPQMDASTWKNQITSETEDDDSDEDSSSRKATTKFKIAISEKSTAEASHSVDNSNQLLSIMKVLKPQSDISLEEPAKENSINAVETIKAPFVFQTESQEQSDNGINNPVSPAIWQDTFSSHPSPISDNSSVKKTESPDVMWDASFNSEPAVWKPSAQAEAKSIFSESPRQSFSGNAAIESTGLDSTFNTPAATASNLHITTSKEFPAPTPDPKEIPKNTFDNSSFSPTTPDVFTSPAAEISSVFGNSGTGPFVTVSSQNEKVNKAPSVEEIAASAFSGPPPALAEIPQSDSTKKSLPDLQKEQRTYELKAATQISNPALKVNVPSANENAAFVKSNEIAAKVETTPSAVPKSVKPEILTRKPKKAPPPPIPTEISPISNSQSKSIGPIPEQNSNTVQAAVKSETPVATSESSPENSTKPSSASDASKSVKNEQTVNQSLHEIAKTQTQFQPANIQASSESIDESPTPVPLARNRKSMISKSSKVEPLSAQGSVQSLLSNDSNRPLNAAQESSGIVQRNRARNLLETAIQNKLMAVASMQQSEIHAAENQEAQPSDAVDSSQKSSVQENSAFISSKPAEKTLPIPPKPPALPPSSPPPDAISRIPPKPPLPSALPPPNQLPKPPLPSNLPPLKPPILPTMPLKMPQPPPLSPPPIGLPPPGATVMPPPNAPQTPKRKSKPPTPAGLEASIKAKALSEPETSQNPPLDTK